MRIDEVMSIGVRTTSPEASAQEAWEQMRLDRIRHLVVLRGRQVVGVISDRDLGGPKGARLRDGRSVAELMTGMPITAAPDTTVRRAANLLRGRTIGCLPVMEEQKLVGIVTLADLLELIGRGGARSERALTTRRSRRWQPPRGAR
ncbi:MAG: CBS domain-containing protein [Myxococcota bacterium]